VSNVAPGTAVAFSNDKSTAQAAPPRGFQPDASYKGRLTAEQYNAIPGSDPASRVSMIGDRNEADKGRMREAFYSLAMNPTLKDKADPSYQARLKQLGETAGLWDKNANQAEINAADNTTALTREGMSQAGANQRAQMGNDIAAGELGLKREAQGFKTREGQRLENLYKEYEAADTPEKKAAALQGIRLIQGAGKDSADEYAYAPGGQVVENGQLITQPGVIFNKRNGQPPKQPERKLPKPTSKQEYDAIPVGSQYISSDGTLLTKTKK
jgi:hypothetical protein